MPLINLQTNLRSLRFGNDRPGGGSSNQPYIQKSIPAPEDSPSNLFNTGGKDILNRGGLLAPIKGVDDVSRLSQMFFDFKSPSGPLFTAKQNLLSRTSVKTEASKGAGYGGGGVNQGVYLPTSTILQAGVGFTGTHLNLLGLNPFDPVSPDGGGLLPGIGLNSYFNIVKNQDKDDNRLVGLYDAISLGEPKERFGGQKGVDLNTNGNTVLLEYGGGPGSILGIGKTRIPFADQRTGKNNPDSKTEYFNKGFRWNDRTTDSWISPLTKGASGKYEDYIGDVGSLIFEDGNPIITPDGGYSYEQNWDYTTTKSGSLKAREDVASGSYQAYRWNTRTTEDFVDPIAKGASEKFKEYGGEDLTNEISKDGGYTWEPSNDFKTTKSGSLEARGDIKTYQASRWNNRTTEDFVDPIAKGASEKFKEYGGEDLTNEISKDGGYTWEPSNDFKTTKSGSLEAREDVANGSYQKLITPDYDKVITSKGVTGLYSSLTKTEIDTNLTDKFFFNVYDPNITPGNTWPINNLTLQRANNSLTFTQTQIIEAPENSGKLTGNPSIQDFRKTLLDGKTESRIMSLAPNYNGENAKNIEERLSLGDPGKTRNVIKYSAGQPALDKINARPFYSAAGPDHSKANNGNDLVKFSIGILQNNGTGISNYIHFRAFIEGFSDSYNATWSDVQYVGRGDKFYNYEGFTREINIGWTVYAQSKAELIPMYKKLNYLATSLAPDYSSGGFMRGSLARLTVGGYLYNQLGIIKGLTYTIPDESTWEIGIDENGANDESVKELAHMIKISGFTFIPIQDDVPQKGRTKFIQLSNGGNTNWDRGFGMPVDQPKTKKEVEAKVEAEEQIETPKEQIETPVETTTNVTLETVTAQDFLYTAEVDNTTNVIQPRL
jgi:hypothetical protein